MNKVIAIKFPGDFRIALQFQDGFNKVINFKPFIGKGISSALSDEDYFQKATIESGGGIMWPNGFDFCPNYLRDFVPAESEVSKL